MSILYFLLASAATALLSHHLWFRPHEPRSLTLILLTTSLLGLPAMYIIKPLVSGWITAYLLASAAYFTFLVTSVVVYRISSYHPLADVPGPRLCKITKLWMAYLAYRGKTHEYCKRVHDEYGMVVRIGPNEISVIDKTLFPSILGANKMPKGPMWDARRLLREWRRSKDHRSLHAARDVKLHAELRKPWNKAFSKDAVSDYQKLLVDRGAELVSRLREQCGGSPPPDSVTVDLSRWLSLFSFDFMGDMAFGGICNLMRDYESFNSCDVMQRSHKLPSIGQHIPWAAPLIHLIPPLLGPTKEFHKFVLAQANQRASLEPQQRDLFYHMINSTDVEQGTSPLAVIKAGAMLAIIAGADTVATTLTTTVYFLLLHPEWMERVREEVDLASQNLSPGHVPHPKDLAHLRILNAVINESLRLYPAVLSQMQRGPAPGSGGGYLGKLFLPEETAVQVPPYVVHRSSTYFSPGPDEFRPNRWLNPSQEEVLDRSAFIPFSMGPANCAGRPIAMDELRFVLALLARNFEMEFAEGYDRRRYEKEIEDRFVTVKGVLPVCLKARK